MGLKEDILKLLKEDEEFRLAVAGILGYREILERLKKHDEKFDEILGEIHKLREELITLSKEMYKLREEFTIMSREMCKLREEFVQLSRRVEVTIGSMGRRWGMDLERTVLKIFRKVLEERGIEPGKVEKFKFRDIDGRITGVKGRTVDVDVLVRDEKVYVIEVKSRTELEHVEMLPEKSKTVERVLKRTVDGMFIVTTNIDREAYERAKELGIEVIYGNILE